MTVPLLTESLLLSGWLQSIIPAIASTNAIIAACCVNECWKMRTNAALRLDNYFMSAHRRAAQPLSKAAAAASPQRLSSLLSLSLLLASGTWAGSLRERTVRRSVTGATLNALSVVLLTSCVWTAAATPPRTACSTLRR